MVIESERLKLIACTIPILESVLESDEILATQLNIVVPKGWSAYGDAAFKWNYNKIKRTGENVRWLTYLTIYKADNMLIGCCGFKGSPENGIVEIGYEIMPAYQQKGLATETAFALINFAKQSGLVKIIQALTSPQNSSSQRVLAKCGLLIKEEITNAEGALEQRWEVVV